MGGLFAKATAEVAPNAVQAQVHQGAMQGFARTDVLGIQQGKVRLG
jgi:hypothetical protein